MLSLLATSPTILISHNPWIVAGKPLPSSCFITCFLFCRSQLWSAADPPSLSSYSSLVSPFFKPLALFYGPVVSSSFSFPYSVYSNHCSLERPNVCHCGWFLYLIFFCSFYLLFILYFYGMLVCISSGYEQKIPLVPTPWLDMRFLNDHESREKSALKTIYFQIFHG